MWRCKGQCYRHGLWPLAEHHMSQTITWYESALDHYSGSHPLLRALWEICDWAQQRSVRCVKCTCICGERLLGVAALRLLSWFPKSRTEITAALCLMWISLVTMCRQCLSVHLQYLVLGNMYGSVHNTVCMCVCSCLHVPAFPRVILGKGEYVSGVFVLLSFNSDPVWPPRH